MNILGTLSLERKNLIHLIFGRKHLNIHIGRNEKKHINSFAAIVFTIGRMYK